MAEDITHIKDLIPDPKNRRAHTSRNVGMIVDALHAVGAARSIVIDEAGTVLAGNATIEAAAEAGITRVRKVVADGNEVIAVQRLGLTPDQKRDLALYDNRTAELASWDVAQLAADLDEGVDLSGQFTEEELAAVLASVETETPAVVSEVTPAVRATTIEHGQVFALGRHRLMCGDSTSVEDVARLMDGAVAEMLFTDPPYGVNYEGGHFHGVGGRQKKREGLVNDESVAIYGAFLPVVLPVVDGPGYLWHAGGADGTRDVYNALAENQCEIHALIIWHKTNATYAALRSHYKLRHEPCLYFKPRGSTLRWCGSTTEATVWNQDRDGINEFHPTQKPIALARKALGNHDVATVLDVFAGSGSTLMAAEEAGRKCYAMEIDPGYCQVVIDRWEAHTEQRAEKLP